MYRGSFSPQQFNLLAIIVIVLGGVLLLVISLRLAFSVTSGLLAPNPPL